MHTPGMLTIASRFSMDQRY